MNKIDRQMNEIDVPDDIRNKKVFLWGDLNAGNQPHGF